MNHAHDIDFRQLSSQDINARMSAGSWTLEAHLPHDRQGNSLLRMVFVTGRIGPHHLHVHGATDLHRVKPGQEPGNTDNWIPIPGTHTWDAVIPADKQSVTIAWEEPAEGARLVRLGWATQPQQLIDSADLSAQIWHADAQHADLQTYREVKKRIDADPTRSPEQIRASNFWLSLDLTTSLADPQQEAPAVAEELGIDVGLVQVDSLRRKWLSELLQVRWMGRANCAAAGTPFDLLIGGVPGEAFTLSKDVARLVLALIYKWFGDDIHAAWIPIVQFACGSIRVPDGGERLNIEPNSMAMASFAEVVDFASLNSDDGDDTDLGITLTADNLDLLRRMFVSMLEPFTQIYAPKGRARRAVYYRYQNLPAVEPGSIARGAWTDERIKAHIATLAPMSYAQLATHWNGVLAEALADETSVERCRKWRMKHLGQSGALPLQPPTSTPASDDSRDTSAGN